MKDTEVGRMIDLLEGWKLEVRENRDTYSLCLYGPRGEGAAFSPERGSVRADVLKAFLEGLLESEEVNFELGDDAG